MFKRNFIITGVLAIFMCFIACGDDLEKLDDSDMRGISSPPAEVMSAINDVLNRWQEGYENEDVDTFMGVFWSQGFRYVGDMGTEGDKTDDFEFDDIRQERDAATHVFRHFQDIDIVLSSPPEVYIDMDLIRAEVRNHYRIQGSVPAGESFQGEFTGWFAEGDNLFILEKRDAEWRITEWYDEAFSEANIQIENDELLPIIWSTLKQTR